MEQTKTCRNCGAEKPITKFSKHSGTADKLDNRCKDCVYLAKEKSRKKGSVTYPIRTFDMDNDDWQVGKIAGTILHRIDSKSGSERYEVRVALGGGKMKSKSFAFSKYESPEDAYIEAEEWLKDYSDTNGLTRNMIKLIDPETIEVRVTKKCVMKTDIQFLDTCQKYTLVTTKGGAKNSDNYVALSINNKNVGFHNYITGYRMVDHINRNPLDNRLSNLRQATHKTNNNNRSVNKNKESGLPLGVRFRMYPSDRDVFIAKIKQDGKEYCKEFSVQKYGFEEAKQMAIDYRQELNERFQCTNG